MTYIGGVRLRTAIIVGALAGVGAGLVFATAHAIIIVPIWNRMLMGLAWGAAAGAVGGWTYTELYPESGAVTGAKYGAMLWLAVAPVSAVDAALRAAGVLPRFELLGVAIAVLLAIVMGAVLGWYRTGRRRGMLAGAVAALLLTMAMGGPVPAARNARAFLIFLAVLPASIVAGTLLGTAIALARKRTSPQELS